MLIDLRRGGGGEASYPMELLPRPSSECWGRPTSPESVKCCDDDWRYSRMSAAAAAASLSVDTAIDRDLETATSQQKHVTDGGGYGSSASFNIRQERSLPSAGVKPKLLLTVLFRHFFLVLPRNGDILRSVEPFIWSNVFLIIKCLVASTAQSLSCRWIWVSHYSMWMIVITAATIVTVYATRLGLVFVFFICNVSALACHAFFCGHLIRQITVRVSERQIIDVFAISLNGMKSSSGVAALFWEMISVQCAMGALAYNCVKSLEVLSAALSAAGFLLISPSVDKNGLGLSSLTSRLSLNSLSHKSLIKSCESIVNCNRLPFRQQKAQDLSIHVPLSIDDNDTAGTIGCLPFQIRKPFRKHSVEFQKPTSADDGMQQQGPMTSCYGSVWLQSPSTEEAVLYQSRLGTSFLQSAVGGLVSCEEVSVQSAVRSQQSFACSSTEKRTTKIPLQLPPLPPLPFLFCNSDHFSPFTFHSRETNSSSSSSFISADSSLVVPRLSLNFTAAETGASSLGTYAMTTSRPSAVSKSKPLAKQFMEVAAAVSHRAQSPHGSVTQPLPH